MSVGERRYLISVLCLWNNILKGYLLLFSLWIGRIFNYQNNHFLKVGFIVLHPFLTPQILKPTAFLFYCVFKKFICHFCCRGLFLLLPPRRDFTFCYYFHFTWRIVLHFLNWAVAACTFQVCALRDPGVANMKSIMYIPLKLWITKSFVDFPGFWLTFDKLIAIPMSPFGIKKKLYTSAN